MPPKHRADVLSNIPMCKEATRCLTEKICMLVSFEGSSYGAAGHEFNVNALTTDIK